MFRLICLLACLLPMLFGCGADQPKSKAPQLAIGNSFVVTKYAAGTEADYTQSLPHGYYVARPTNLKSALHSIEVVADESVPEAAPAAVQENHGKVEGRGISYAKQSPFSLLGNTPGNESPEKTSIDKIGHSRRACSSCGDGGDGGNCKDGVCPRSDAPKHKPQHHAPAPRFGSRLRRALGACCR